MSNDTPKYYKPQHYNKHFQPGSDVFDIIYAYDLTPGCGMAVKYLVRAGRKPGNNRVDDLRKLIRCIEREIGFVHEREFREANPSEPQIEEPDDE